MLKQLIVVPLVLALTTTVVLATVLVTRTISTRVSIRTPPGPSYSIQVYEEDRQTLLTSIEWGTMAPGAETEHEGWLLNDGEAALAIVSFANPPAGLELQAYLKQEGTWVPWASAPLSPGSEIKVKWKLTASADLSDGDYAFDIVVEGHEQIP